MKHITLLRSGTRLAGILVCVAVTLTLWLGASEPDEPAAANGVDRPVAPLFDRLGPYTKPVSTRDPLAQRYFDQGMMFLWGFNHREAIRSFTAAATRDAGLAMAWWGVAFAHGPNINAPMEDGALPPAQAALHKARSLARRAAPWERDYIEALGTRYAERPGVDQNQLNAAYAEAMRAVAQRYPRDLDAAVLYADAVMNTMAWDYWQADKVTPKPATREIVELVEAVLRQDPQHPGANHALIHLLEAGPSPGRALASAEALKSYAPDAGHLVHMPSHIFMRTGRYHAAALANERAAESDRAYIAACRVQGFYPGMYYPHNEHFLWWAYTFEGRQADARAKAAAIIGLATSPLCGTPVAEKPRFTHLHLLTAVRFGDGDAILTAPEPAAAEALDRVMWHWARATALAQRGDAHGAGREAKAARELAGGPAVAAMDNAYLPAVKIAEIAALLAEGRAAFARRDTKEAVRAFRAAVELEDRIPYMEPAFWFYPTRHTLGATLLAAGRTAEAIEVFRADLRIWPENGWSLHGLVRALEQQGDTAELPAVRAQFEAAWRHADIRPNLAHY